MKFEWCIGTKGQQLSMGYRFRKKNLLVQLDDGKTSEENRQIKEETAVAHGYHILHLHKAAIWENSYDWKEFLRNFVEKLEGEPKIWHDPTYEN